MPAQPLKVQTSVGEAQHARWTQILYSNCTHADMWNWARMSAVVQYYRGPQLDANTPWTPATGLWMASNTKGC
jgi:hypothetical protein